MTDDIENRLPVHLLEKSIKSGSEYGWREENFLEVVEAARNLQIAIEGGQVQYFFDDGTYELSWLHYYTEMMKPNENWVNFCNRTAKECTTKFNSIISRKNIEREAIDNFIELKQRSEDGIDIKNHKLFTLTFEDKKM